MTKTYCATKQTLEAGWLRYQEEETKPFMELKKAIKHNGVAYHNFCFTILLNIMNLASVTAPQIDFKWSFKSGFVESS